jgi:hypothetical protein
LGVASVVDEPGVWFMSENGLFAGWAWGAGRPNAVNGLGVVEADDCEAGKPENAVVGIVVGPAVAELALAKGVLLVAAPNGDMVVDAADGWAGGGNVGLAKAMFSEAEARLTNMPSGLLSGLGICSVACSKMVL